MNLLAASATQMKILPDFTSTHMNTSPEEILNQQLELLAEFYQMQELPDGLFDRLKARFLARKDQLEDAELEWLAAAGTPQDGHQDQAPDLQYNFLHKPKTRT